MLETWWGLETFESMSFWQTKFIDEIIPIFDDTFKNLLLVCHC